MKWMDQEFSLSHFSSVADPECLSRIPYLDFFRIPDPTRARGGGENLLSYLLRSKILQNLTLFIFEKVQKENLAN
jgi:hypothetical protein